MGKIFDVIVVGLGAMGSAVAYHLARRKYRVLGLDRFCPPHALGSSHGQSRIIREAYFEDPVYVPLVRRAYELWRELEGGTGRRLLRQTGGLMIGPADGVLVAGARRSAETHGLAHEVMAAAEVRRRFPALRVPDEMTAVWEPRAGVLAPELGIWAHLDLARQFGAALQWEETVLSWNTSENDVRVVTNQGEYEAGRLILSAGPWIVTLARDLAAEFRVERQVQFWFEPNGTPSFAPEVCPVHLWEHAPNRFFYGFPDLGAGVKVAGHHEGADTTVEDVNRSVSPEEVAVMRALLSRFLPGANGALRRAAVCLYTNTADGHFLIDAHPAHPAVLIVSPCSGHGFKFAPVIGEIAAAWVEGREGEWDVQRFRWRSRSGAKPG